MLLEYGNTETNDWSVGIVYAYFTRACNSTLHMTINCSKYDEKTVVLVMTGPRTK